MLFVFIFGNVDQYVSIHGSALTPFRGLILYIPTVGTLEDLFDFKVPHKYT